MSNILGGLKPEGLWKHFEAILAIPHGSGNEKGVGDYIVSVAQKGGLEWTRDKVGNVLVRKPASPGLEGRPGIIMQGHMDMVCEKNSDVVHDFLKDPIVPEISGEWVHAVGTSLGADNGIGAATCLAVMEDGSLIHGPLEFLFTVDEETGLTGANNLGRNVLKGRMLLNLDSEEDSTFTIGCAGGADSEISLPIERKKTASKNLFLVKLTGFQGGHSGMDIDKGRANTNKLLARMLVAASEAMSLDLVDIEGGSKRNAIAREAFAVVACEPAKAAALKKSLNKTFADIKNEFQYVEKEAALVLQPIKGEKGVPMTRESRDTFLRLILGIPHGVMAMHGEIKDLVETSTNLAIVKTAAKEGHIVCSTRSSVASSLAAVRQMLKAVCDLAGAKAVIKDGYPGWQPDLNSSLLKKMVAIYTAQNGHEPQVAAIHAGLECGIIGQKYPGMEMISFGPTLKDVHSPKEKANIPSVAKFWELIRRSLAEL